MLTWLSDEPRGRGYWKFIAKVALFNCVWLSFMILLGVAIGVIPDPVILKEGVGEAILTVFITPIEEEIEVRLIPLVIGRLLDIAIGQRFVFTPITLIVSIVAFGLLHGYVASLLIQGVLGLTCGLVFLKCGGMRGKWGFAKAYGSSVLVHVLWNLFAQIVGVFANVILFG